MGTPSYKRLVFVRRMKKVLVAMLLFSFLYTPVSVSAQVASDAILTVPVDVPTDSAVPADTTTTDSSIPSAPSEGVSSDPPPPSDSEAPPAEPDAASPDGGIQASALSGPSSDVTPVETTKKTLDPKFYREPDPVTGSLSYSYPIVVPPGRNGMQPDIQLTYSSQPGEDISPFGYGWDVNIPYIERINRKGVDKLYTQSYYRSSLDGELYQISTTTNTWGPRIEYGASNQYQATSSYWIMTDKLGTTYKFGTTSGARLDNTASSTQVFRWMLQEVTDTNGNKIIYSYAKDQGQIYPSKINYTYTATTTGPFEIEFLRENRSDIATSTKAGFPIVDSQRIYEIDVKINGSWVRKYVMTYTTGDNGTRSLLNTVTESGKDEQGTVVTLPATTFSYQKVMSKGWVEQQGIHVLHDFTGGMYFADVNGDGLTDIIHSYSIPFDSFNKTYLSTGNGWVASTTWDMPVYFVVNSPDGTKEQSRLADVNGDGLVDVVNSYQIETGGGGEVKETYINNGAGWTASSTWRLPVYLSSNGGGSCAIDRGVRLADANGDGLTDVLQSGCVATSTVYYNNGAGWTQASTTIPVSFSDGTPATKNVRLEDVNGDSMVDIVKSYAGTHETYLNASSSWNLTPQWAVPVDFADSDTSDRGVRFADVNGDGLLDLVHGYSNLGETSNKIYLNTGNGWIEDPEWHTPTPFTTSFIPVSGDDTIDDLVRIADVNGDGLPDLISGYGSASSSVIYFNVGQRADLLVQAAFPTGGNTTFAYKASQSYTSSPGVLLSPKLPVAVATLQSVATNDGINSYASTTYSYTNGKYYFASPFDRRFAGFNQITKIDPDGNVTKTFYHQGDTSASTTGEYQDDQSKIGQSYRVERYDSSNNLYSKTINHWDKADLGNSRAFVKLVRTSELTYDGNGTHKDKASTYTYYDSTNNVATSKNWGEVTASDDGYFSDTGSDIVTQNFAYAASSTGRILGLLSQASTTDQSGTKIAEQRLYYDSLSLNSVNIGNLTKDEKWITGSTYASSTKSYNGIGLVTSEKDPKGNTTSYIYDANYLYPATSTNALSQSTKYVYDYSLGKAATTTDGNNAAFITVYDGLDRIVAIKQPDSATTSSVTVTKVTYTYTDTALPSVRQTTNLSTATSSDAYFYLDGFGRLVQQRGEAEKGSDYAVKDFKYNARGLLLQESLPYFSNGSGKTSATGNKKLYATYTYDPLARVSGVGNAVGTTTTSYDDWKVTVTDANGHSKDLTYDALNNLTKVTEHVSTTTYDTVYTYDGNGNLTKITDAIGNVRNFTYDGLNRILKAEDLHTVGDTAFGSSTYAYDVASNRTQWVNPRSQTVNYTYDALNRLSTEDYTGQAGTEKTYTYDSCTNGVGRLCLVNTSSASTTYTYSKTGMPVSESRAINGPASAYLTMYAYDTAGNITQITYPDLAKVNYLYGSAGQLDAVTEQDNGTTTVNTIVTDFDYGPTGAVTYQKDGNGTETFSTYDADQLYRLTDKKTIGPGGMMGMMMALGGGEAMRSASTSGTSSPSLLSSMALSASNPLPEDSSGPQFLGVVGKGKNARSIYQTRLYAVSPEVASSPTIGQSSVGTLFTLPLKDGAISLSVADGKSVAVAPSTRSASDGAKTYEYPNALGTGADIDLIAGDGFVKKDIVLRSMPASVAAGSDYSVTFRLTAAGTSTLSVQTGEGGAATLLKDGKAAAYIWAPYAEAATRTGRDDQRIPITLAFAEQADGLYVTKTIPGAWLRNASYPVHADLTLSTFAGWGDGVVETAPYPSSWSYQHATTTGRETNHNAFSANVGVASLDSTNGYLYIDRGYFPFDTSSLPDNAVISTTTLYLHATSTKNDYNDAYSYLTVYQSTQASPTALRATDIDNCGDAETNPTKGSSDVTLASATTTGYMAFPLNTTGKGWVSKTGWTTLCLREGHDATNNAITFVGATWKESRATFTTTEFPGTSTDPYLDVIYTVPNTAPLAPDNMLVMGASNPSNISTSTPYFTSRFNDPDLGEYAASYQIQVATSSGFTTVVWDSGKTALATPLAKGNQSPNIAYAGTPLTFDASTYYWRMKYWDDEDSAGPYSTSSDRFTMGNDGTVLQQFHYTYDPVGNVTSITDHGGLNASRTTYYSYDELNRLAQASTASSTVWTYTYSPLGNLISVDEQSGSGGNSNSLDLESGTTDYAYHNDASAYDITGDLTIEAWVKPESLPTSGNTVAFAGKYDFDNNQRSYYLGYANVAGTGKLRFVTSNACTSFVEGDLAYTLTTGTWYHIAASKSGSTVTFYVNGTLVGTASVDAGQCNSNAKFAVGALIANSAALNFDGLIDDVRLWSVARSGVQISANMSTALTGAESGLAAYYKLDNLYTDATANGNTLTASGSPAFSSDVPFSGGSHSITTYSYAGTGYANPHAVTQTVIGAATTTFTYDNSGNMLTGGMTNTWDYLSRLTQSGNGAATSTYAYDDQGQRVKYAAPSGTSWYPNQYFTVSTSTTEKDIYANGVLVGSVSTQGATTTRTWAYQDHLGSTDVVGSSAGLAIEDLTYTPYGANLEDTQSSSVQQSRKYIGQEYDGTNQLSYLNARYMSGARGQFISQDPVFNENPKAQNLAIPQSLNSYSYANDNPISYSDPSGRFLPLLVAGLVIANGAIYSTVAQGVADSISGTASGYERYAGAAVGGGLYTGMTLGSEGLSLINPGAGFVSSAAGSFVEQGLNNLSKKQRGINAGDIILDGGVGAGTSLIPGLKISGVSAGRNSYSAIAQQMLTKASNGTISAFSSQLSNSTAYKIVTSGIVNNSLGTLAQITSSVAGNIAKNGLTASNKATLDSLSKALSTLSKIVKSLTR